MHARSFLSRVALLAQVVTASAFCSSAQAAVTAEPPSISLGFIEPRESVTRTFRLVNGSDSPVTIVSATPSCTCTTLEAAGKVIPPRGSIEVPMTMKVAASTGLKSASVAFVFSDASPPLSITMSGEIAYAVRGTSVDITNGSRVPYINAFRDPAAPPTSAKVPLDGVVTVGSIDQVPFTINSVMCAPPVFVGFDPMKDAPRSSYEVRYDFSAVACAQMPPYLIIETDHPKSPVADMRIRHLCTRISAKIPFAEYRANLGAVVPGVALPFEFELKHAAGWNVVETVSKDPRIVVNLVGQHADSEAAMISLVATTSQSARGVILAPITMTATDPDGAKRTSDFWVYCVVRPSDSSPEKTTQKLGS